MLGDAYVRFQEPQIAQAKCTIEGELRAAQTGSRNFDKRVKLIQTALKSQQFHLEKLLFQHESSGKEVNAEYVACLTNVQKRMGEANGTINGIAKQALELSRSRNNYPSNDNLGYMSPNARDDNSSKLRNM